MPTYDYKCDACGYQFEKFQQMTDEPLHKCPECGGEVRRLLGTGAGVIFKGSGFYQNDYAHKSSGSSPRCGSGQTCCGREERCDTPPCHQ